MGDANQIIKSFLCLHVDERNSTVNNPFFFLSYIFSSNQIKFHLDSKPTPEIFFSIWKEWMVTIFRIWYIQQSERYSTKDNERSRTCYLGENQTNKWTLCYSNDWLWYKRMVVVNWYSLRLLTTPLPIRYSTMPRCPLAEAIWRAGHKHQYN